MAKVNKTNIQNYPRIEDDQNPYHGFFNDSKITPHTKKISEKDLKKIIKDAVKTANLKSSRAILNIGDNISEEELNKIYIKEGKALFKYFIKYCGDPAYTAFDCTNQHFSKVAKEQFRNKTIQKERLKMDKLHASIRNSIKDFSISIKEKSEYYKLVLEVLLEHKFYGESREKLNKQIISEFGHHCNKNGLLKDGYFNDPYRLAGLLCKVNEN
jgi:hypothetical protein